MPLRLRIISLLLAASISGSSLLAAGEYPSMSNQSSRDLSIFVLEEAGMPVSVSSGKPAGIAVFLPHYLIPKNPLIKFGKLFDEKFAESCLFINSFARNVFYTFVSIHAP